MRWAAWMGLVFALLGGARAAEPLTLVYPAYPGYVDAQARGLYVALARAVFPAPQYELRVRIVPFARAVAMVSRGEAQLLPGTNLPGDGLQLSQAVTDRDVVSAAVLRGGFPDWQGAESLRGRRVVAQIGFAYQRYTEVPMRYEERHDLKAMLRMMLLGRVDAVLDYGPRIDEALGQIEGRERIELKPGVLVQPLYFAFQKNPKGDRLRKVFDEGFERLLREGRLRALYEAQPLVLKAAYPPALSPKP